ncbi:MAG: 23S rRNA (guanosine(2251)-2'-O)-methyltransferase RlmB [Hyphomicrobiales bacterium]
MKLKNPNLIYGSRVVIEAIDAGKEIDKLFIQKGLSNELVSELRTKLRENNIPYQLVPVEKLNRITRKNHQGVVGFLSEISYQDIYNLVPMLFEQGKNPFIVVLDGVTDVRNMGAIARTCECAGVNAILMPIKGSAQINADAIKTSAGALHKIPVCRVPSLKSAVKYLQECGIQLVASTEKTSNLYYNIDLTTPSAIIMGSEEDGVSNDILRIVDHHAKIPMTGKIGSLNVSVSAGVMIYEVVKQRILSK